MKDYEKFSQDHMPLSNEQCLKRYMQFLRIVELKEDKELSDKIAKVSIEKKNQASALNIYLAIGLTGVLYSRYTYLKPHTAGIFICMMFAYGVGRMYGSLHSMDDVVKAIGQLSDPELEKSRLEILRRCRGKSRIY
jgi:hypothetical protein